MQLIFLNPTALWLLLLGLVPAIVHLLVKRPARRVPFPTLRFVPRSASRAARLHRVSDWALLLVRTLVVAAAAAAIARPLLVTPGRMQTWERRVSRLIVVDASASARGGLEAARRAAAIEAAGAAASTVIETGNIGAAIRSAAAAMAAFPPSRREIVLISDFQEGTLDAALAADVPEAVGLRAVALSSAPPSTSGPPAPGVPDVLVSPRHAGAARRAVLAVAARNGVSPSPADSRVLVALRGFDELLTRRDRTTAPWMADVIHQVNLTSREHIDWAAVNGRLVIVADIAPESFAFPLLLEAAYRGLVDEHAMREAVLPRESKQAVDALQRVATAVPPEAVRHASVDDARWWWAVAAVLMGVEGWLRSRGPRRAAVREALAA